MHCAAGCVPPRHSQRGARAHERCVLCPPQDAAEFGRIGKYYAVESMLVWDPVKEVYLEDATPSYGQVGGLLAVAACMLV